jgi:hypothetical protein
MSVKLLETLKAEAGLKTDAALADVLDVYPPVLSKIRRGIAPGASMILAIHERIGMPVWRIRKLMSETDQQSCS